MMEQKEKNEFKQQDLLASDAAMLVNGEKIEKAQETEYDLSGTALNEL